MKPVTENVLAIILGGGSDSWLYPLTKTRAKPAVYLGGKYRLIDITISNCINAGIFQIAVLTQFNSVSLHRHISNSYNFDFFHYGSVQIWAADQTNSTCEWYLGTADAVRKKLPRVQQNNPEYVLIMGADDLYRMDFLDMIKFHTATNADITLGTTPISTEDTSRFGVLKMNDIRRITDFYEKPSDPMILNNLVSFPENSKPYLASMGMYLLKTEVLADLLQTYSGPDFARDIITPAIQHYNISGYVYNGFWEDLGTIRSYYDTNLKLASGHLHFDFYNPDLPIYTSPRYLPGSIVEKSHLEKVLLAEGCILEEATIHHSIIGLRSRIRKGARVVDSIIFGADRYLAYECCEPGMIPTGIGENCDIEGAIIDENVRMGDGCIIRPYPRGTNLETELWAVRDGIVIIPKDVTIPEGTVIGP